MERSDGGPERPRKGSWGVGKKKQPGEARPLPPRIVRSSEQNSLLPRTRRQTSAHSTFSRSFSRIAVVAFRLFCHFRGSLFTCSVFAESRAVFRTLAEVRHTQIVVFHASASVPQSGSIDATTCGWCTKCQFGVFSANLRSCRYCVYVETWTLTQGVGRSTRSV